MARIELNWDEVPKRSIEDPVRNRRSARALLEKNE
jgi:hypothetical protein